MQILFSNTNKQKPETTKRNKYYKTQPAKQNNLKWNDNPGESSRQAGKKREHLRH